MSDILISKDELMSIFGKSFTMRCKEKLENYNSPLDSIVQKAFVANETTISQAVNDAMRICVEAPDFSEHLVAALNHKLANLIINKCSGLVESAFAKIMKNEPLRVKLQAAVIDMINKGVR